MSSSLDLLQGLIEKAHKAGADDAEAMRIAGTSLSVSWREGKLDNIEQSDATDIGLRVLIGKKQASISTSDLRPASLDRIVEQVVAMAKAVPEDPYCGLATGKTAALPDPESLELYDPNGISPAELTELAHTTFDATMEVQGVEQCESADAGAGSSLFELVNSNGFAATLRHTSFGFGTSAIAGTGTEMTQGSDYSSAVWREDLRAAAEVGRKAGQEAVQKLGARKMPTAQIPVVFDSEIAPSLVRCLAGAISGPRIARGTSFLKDKMGSIILPETISIIDDPFRVRGLRSRPFDAEGLVPERRKIIDAGRLTTWFLDLRSARQLGLESTGHATTSPGSVPSPSPCNLYMEAGNVTPDELIRDIKSGFYVTELMGDGANLLTGDYSLAAQGFWIENGHIAFPVHEMTIAGNLKDMFLNLTPANNLLFRFGVDAPTIRIEGMTVAGL